MEISLETNHEIATDSMMCAVLEGHLYFSVRMRVARYLSARHFVAYAKFFAVCLIAKTTFVGTYFHCFLVTFAGFDMHLNLFEF